MRIIEAWLREHLESSLSWGHIGERLTSLGLEVESMIEPRDDLEHVHVVELVGIERHPNADRLNVCHWRGAHGEEGRVVCGAPNVRVGMKTLRAGVGVRLRGWKKPLKRATIRGVVSEGMLCSSQELGVGDDERGIIDMPSDVVLGETAAEALGLGVYAVDIALTPDRGDCASVRGVARDLAAAGCGCLKPLSPLSVSSVGGGKGEECIMDMDKETQAVCGLFFLQSLKNVANGHAPSWMRNRLRSCGVRTHHMLVDVTNYMMLDVGQPMHVFDRDKIEGDVHVRLSRAGEPFRGLDGGEHVLAAGLLVVADVKKILSVAGVMGGASSGCDERTRNVLVEAAYFKPEAIARGGRFLGVHSGARYRFERGVDRGHTRVMLERGVDMIRSLGGGDVSTLFVGGRRVGDMPLISFHESMVEKWSGVSVASGEARACLRRLGFVEKTPTMWRVPDWRFDVHVAQDLVGDILRVRGYDTIEGVAFRCVDNPRGSIGACASSYDEMALARLAASLGAWQVVHWVFVSEADVRAFTSSTGDVACDVSGVALANPLSRDMGFLRSSLLSGLLHAVRRNCHRGIKRGAFFEQGVVWREGRACREMMHCAIVRWGEREERSWRVRPSQVSLFDAKQDFMSLLDGCGVSVDDVGLEQGRLALPLWFAGHGEHGRPQEKERHDHEILGHYGMLSSSHASLYDLEGVSVSMTELYMDRLIPYVHKKGRKDRRGKRVYRPSVYQDVVQDFAFVMGRDVYARDIIAAVSSVKKREPLIRAMHIFDYYQGRQMDDGRKSIGVSLLLRSDKATLTEETIQRVRAQVIDHVQACCGAVLRA